jgi:hypothetical protein
MNPLRGLASDAEALVRYTNTDAVTESDDGFHVAFIAQPEVATSLILKAIASAQGQ